MPQLHLHRRMLRALSEVMHNTVSANTSTRKATSMLQMLQKCSPPRWPLWFPPLPGPACVQQNMAELMAPHSRLGHKRHWFDTTCLGEARFWMERNTWWETKAHNQQHVREPEVILQHQSDLQSLQFSQQLDCKLLKDPELEPATWPTSGFLISELYEIINASCWTLLNLGIICYAAVPN